MNNYTISASSLSDFQKCPTNYHYSKELRIEPKEPKEYLIEGTWFHLILQSYYKGLKEGRPAADVIQECLEQGRRELVNLDLTTSEHDLMAAFRAYTRNYANDNWIPLFVEQPFSKVLAEIPSHDARFILEGKIDLLVRPLANMSLIVDHKIGKRESTRVRRDNQNFAYAYATGLDNVVINKVNLEQPNQMFTRQTIPLDRTLVNEWASDVVQDLTHLLDYQKSGKWPKHTTQCAVFNNLNSACQYLPICDVTPELREWIIHSKFKSKPEFNLYPAAEGTNGESHP